MATGGLAYWGEQVSGLQLGFTLFTNFHAKNEHWKLQSPAFSSVALSIQDIEDEKFWKAIYCLLRAVFPALKALGYFDINYPAMYKIYYLAHRDNDAILKLAMDFDDVDLFGPIWVTEMTGIDLEMSEVFGEKLEFEG